MIRLGCSTRDLTPNRPALLAGQKHRRIGASALDPVSVTAWALDAGDSAPAIVLVSCDLVAPTAELVARVRAEAGRRLREILPERVILFATHTHTSFALDNDSYEAPGGEVMTSDECLAWVAERAIGAVEEAWNDRRSRRLVRAFGHAVVGHNRYATYADGSFKMYGKTDREDFLGFGGGEDHGVDLLLAFGEDAKLEGVAAAIPCPAQVSEHSMQFSADYWHEVRVELRRRYGERLSLLPMCGAAGDQSPHLLLYGKQEEEMRARRGLTPRQEIARRVGEAVALAVESAASAPALEGMLAHVVRRIALAPREVSKADCDWARAQLEAARNAGQEGWFERSLRRVLDLYEGKRQPEPFTAELHAVRLGDFAMVTNPFELFLDYAQGIKARSPAGQTAVVQLTERGMYLPSERAVRGGGYGVNPAVSKVGPEGGRRLVEETLAMLNELFR
ncbi:MAG: hypothetical protein IT578_07045 [Verrucomicrobiae bacterium]|nr:hypothetical protein [Verrucomicrobiae bacterium]